MESSLIEPMNTKTKPAAADWAQLEATAESGNEHGFVVAYRSVEWDAQSPEDLLRGVRLAIAAGAPLVARRLATEGATRYPEHAELQKAARILAPPKLIRSDLPCEPGMAKNAQWLKKERTHYRGKWVAVRNGQLLGTADTLHILVERFGKQEDILYTVA